MINKDLRVIALSIAIAILTDEIWKIFVVGVLLIIAIDFTDKEK